MPFEKSLDRLARRITDSRRPKSGNNLLPQRVGIIMTRVSETLPGRSLAITLALAIAAAFACVFLAAALWNPAGGTAAGCDFPDRGLGYPQTPRLERLWGALLLAALAAVLISRRAARPAAGGFPGASLPRWASSVSPCWRYFGAGAACPRVRRRGHAVPGLHWLRWFSLPAVLPGVPRRVRLDGRHDADRRPDPGVPSQRRTRSRAIGATSFSAGPRPDASSNAWLPSGGDHVRLRNKQLIVNGSAGERTLRNPSERTTSTISGTTFPANRIPGFRPPVGVTNSTPVR